MQSYKDQCRKHGLTEFTRRGKWRRCIKCNREHTAAHRKKIKDALLSEFGEACVLCGYGKCKRNLHFHHVDKDGKCFGVMNRTVTSIPKLLQEARKCVLLCANCHGEVEDGIRTIPEEFLP